MSFPSKFRDLLKTTLADVETPDAAWLVYAVCAVTDDACGWGGWIIDAALKTSTEANPAPPGFRDMALPADYEQRCPRCGRDTFRTSAILRFEPSENQEPTFKEGVDYETVPMEWH